MIIATSSLPVFPCVSLRMEKQNPVSTAKDATCAKEGQKQNPEDAKNVISFFLCALSVLCGEKVLLSLNENDLRFGAAL
jgi:hypothetical protein